MGTETDGAQAVWAYTELQHRDLVRGTNQIHDLAYAIDRLPTSELSVHVLDVLGWLDGALTPHMAWEEAWLYPQIDERAGTPWATHTARIDHQQIREFAAKLRADQQSLGHDAVGDQRVAMLWHVLGLEALVRAHIEREERFLIPLLEGRRPVPPDAGGRGSGPDVRSTPPGPP